MLFDTHAHMNDPAFAEDREAILLGLQEKGVGLMMNVGCCRESSRDCVAMAEKYPFVYASVGSHPDSANEVDEEALEEYKELCKTMILNCDKYGDIRDTVLATIEQLDFSKGHANSTFEIAKSYVEPNKVGTLVLNIGTARYLFNKDINSVFYIDHTKRISGHMLKSPEKEEIIGKIYSSKTMTKKIENALNS